MQTLRIFISSPGDVGDERQLAGKVIERLQGKYWSFVRLDDVFWEEKVVRSTAHYQDELANPGNCDIVVGVLWTRLGSPLPEKFRKASGERYHSGTEWELEMAFDAYDRRLKETGDPLQASPDIVVYRRVQTRSGIDDPVREAEAVAQEQALAGYLKGNFFFGDGTIKRPVTQYHNLDEFEELLTHNLEELILRKLPTLKPGFEPPPISGSPFKGLLAFDFADSDRYFGRNREIRQMEDRLRAAALKGLPFLLIYGGSGFGKSSLMRAGLAPVLTRPGGSLPEIGEWRRVSFQPAKGKGTLCQRLAGALLLPSSDGEIELSRLHEHWPLMGLAELAEWFDAEELSRQFSDDEARPTAAEAIAGVLTHLDRHLLLELDQLEEVFTTTGFDAAQRSAFFQTVRELSGSGRVWVVATMRSEFFPRVAEQPELLNLVGKERGYILPPPDRQSLREMIRYPALAARLDYQRRTTELEIGGETAKSECLDDQILEDAEASPDSLPLLAFTLRQLYDDLLDPEDPEGRRRATDLLQWQTYQSIGGLKGAIAKRAREVFSALSPAAQEARHRIFAALVHADTTGHTFARQRAPRSSLDAGEGASEFLEAFLSARLLVSDDDGESHQAVVTLAHDALITHWQELAIWNKEHQGDLLARQRLREQTELWLENGRRTSYLLSEARLAEAQRVAMAGLFILPEEEQGFLALSASRSRRKLRILQAAVAVFAVLALVAALLWRESVAQKRTAEDKERQIRKNASRADFMVACEKQSDRPDLAMAHLVRALTYDPDNAAAMMRMLDLMRQRSWPQLVAAFGDEGHLVRRADLSMDGKRVVTASLDDHTARLWNAATGEPLCPPMKHSGGVFTAEFSPDGKRVVTTSEDRTARLWDGLTGQPLGEVMRHYTMVSKASFSPDGSRVATVAGKEVGIWDGHTGLPVTKDPIRHEHSVDVVVFSPDSRFLATAEGAQVTRPTYNNRRHARIWDAFTGKAVGKPMEHDDGIKNLAFSPDGQRLATASWDQTARVWTAATGEPVGEPMRHQSAVQTACFSPDGKKVVTGCALGKVQVWEAETGKATGTVIEQQDVGVIRYSPNGKIILTASGDGHSGRWDAETGELLGWPMRHRDIVEVAKFGADAREIMTVAFFSKTAQLWRYRNTRSVVQRIGRGESVLLDARFSSDSKLVATASVDTARVWEAVTGRAAGPPLPHKCANVHFMPGGEVLATASRIGETEGKVAFWNFRTGQPVGQSIALPGEVSTCAFSPDGKLVLTITSNAKGNRQAQVWDVVTGKVIAAPSGIAPFHDFASFSSDSQRFVAPSSYESAAVWDAVSGALVSSIMNKRNLSILADKYMVSDAVFSPDGKWVAVAGGDSVATVYDIAAGLRVGKPMMLDGCADKVRFDPLGSRLLTKANTLRVWSINTGEPVSETMGKPGISLSAEFDPTGRWVVGASTDDGTGRIWDAETGKELWDALEFGRRVNTASFSPDGHLVVFGAADGALVQPVPDVARPWQTSELGLLLEIATYLCANQFDLNSGQLRILTTRELAALRARIIPRRDDPCWGHLISWLFDPVLERPIWPVPSPTVRHYLRQRPDILVQACEKNDLELAKLALQAGVKPDQTDETGLTPLAVAEKNGHAELLRLLKETPPQDAPGNPPASHDMPQSGGDPTTTAPGYAQDPVFLSNSHEELADIYSADGEMGLARKNYEEALATREELLERNPRNAHLLQGVAILHDKLLRLPSDDKSRRHHAEAQIRLLGPVVQAGPDNPPTLRLLRAAHTTLTLVCYREKNLAAARSHCAKEIEITQRLLLANPGDTKLQTDLSISYGQVGQFAREGDDLKSARVAVAESMKIRLRLLDADPNNPKLLRYLSLNHEAMGLIAMKEADWESAKTAFVKAMEIRKRLAETNPESNEASRDLGMGFYQLGFLAQKAGSLADAKEAFEQCLAIRSNLVAANPENSTFRKELAQTHYDLGSLAKDGNSQEDATRHRKECYKILHALQADGIPLIEFSEHFEELQRELNPP